MAAFSSAVDPSLRPPRTNWFFRVRVSILLGILLLVLGWAARDMQQRRARNAWEAPVRVALVVLRLGPTEPAGVHRLMLRTRALEQRLSDEFRRYHPGAPNMFRFETFGPLEITHAPPSDTGNTLLERAIHAFSLWRYTTAVNTSARLDSRDFDARLYLVIEPTQGGQQFVEGFSEDGGRIGVARVNLDPTTVDLSLFVAGHELLHTLGARDKYDAASGFTLIPDGLAEPDRYPLYPQRGAEVMARNRVLMPGAERPPEALGELFVGRATAREIGWLK
ncbi:MAG TPA: hypothetical protein VFQ61_38145 [Polyangiaceae bacterium]|nr:hypothetical protein [Polyangiaceae bacterium]